jgi:hypothetical protein
MAERDPRLRAAAAASPAYEQDYAAWLAAQVGLLRDGCFDRLDWENLIDEVESLGRSDFKGFVSAIEVVLIHMLKWDHQPPKRSPSWQKSIVEHRRRIEAELEDSPSYAARIDDAVRRAYRTAPAVAARQTRLPLSQFPDHCPYDWQEITTRPHELGS